MTQTVADALSQAFMLRGVLHRQATSLATKAAGSGLGVMELLEFYRQIQHTFNVVGPLIARDVSNGGDLDLDALATANLIDPPVSVLQTFADAQMAGNAFQLELDKPDGLIPTHDGTDTGYRLIVQLLPAGGQLVYRSYTSGDLTTVLTLLNNVKTATA